MSVHVPVPCGDCRLCCKNDIVVLEKNEEAKYQSEKSTLSEGERMIAHKKNRDCIYLRSYGCSVHDDKPRRCSTMDCRVLLDPERGEVVRALLKMGGLNPKIIERAKQLIAEEQIKKGD